MKHGKKDELLYSNNNNGEFNNSPKSMENPKSGKTSITNNCTHQDVHSNSVNDKRKNDFHTIDFLDWCDPKNICTVHENCILSQGSHCSSLCISQRNTQFDNENGDNNSIENDNRESSEIRYSQPDYSEINEVQLNTTKIEEDKKKKRIQLKPKQRNNSKKEYKKLTKNEVNKIFNVQNVYNRVEDYKFAFNKLLLDLIEESDSITDKIAYDILRNHILNKETHKYHVLDY